MNRERMERRGITIGATPGMLSRIAPNARQPIAKRCDERRRIRVTLGLDRRNRQVGRALV
jgi:hypothetical protein